MVRDPYARWCGRGGPARCPPIPISSVYHTFFRNYTTGFRAEFTDYLSGVVVNDIAQQSTNGPLRPASAHAYAYWFNFIGNVLGVPGQMGNFIYWRCQQLG